MICRLFGHRWVLFGTFSCREWRTLKPYLTKLWQCSRCKALDMGEKP